MDSHNGHTTNNGGDGHGHGPKISVDSKVVLPVIRSLDDLHRFFNTTHFPSDELEHARIIVDSHNSSNLKHITAPQSMKCILTPPNIDVESHVQKIKARRPDHRIRTPTFHDYTDGIRVMVDGCARTVHIDLTKEDMRLLDRLNQITARQSGLLIANKPPPPPPDSSSILSKQLTSHLSPPKILHVKEEDDTDADSTTVKSKRKQKPSLLSSNPSKKKRIRTSSTERSNETPNASSRSKTFALDGNSLNVDIEVKNETEEHTIKDTTDTDNAPEHSDSESLSSTDSNTERIYNHMKLTDRNSLLASSVSSNHKVAVPWDENWRMSYCPSYDEFLFIFNLIELRTYNRDPTSVSYPEFLKLIRQAGVTRLTPGVLFKMYRHWRSRRASLGQLALGRGLRPAPSPNDTDILVCFRPRERFDSLAMNNGTRGSRRSRHSVQVSGAGAGSGGGGRAGSDNLRLIRAMAQLASIMPLVTSIKQRELLKARDLALDLEMINHSIEESWGLEASTLAVERRRALGGVGGRYLPGDESKQIGDLLNALNALDARECLYLSLAEKATRLMAEQSLSAEGGDVISTTAGASFQMVHLANSCHAGGDRHHHHQPTQNISSNSSIVNSLTVNKSINSSAATSGTAGFLSGRRQRQSSRIPPISTADLPLRTSPNVAIPPPQLASSLLPASIVSRLSLWSRPAVDWSWHSTFVNMDSLLSSQPLLSIGAVSTVGVLSAYTSYSRLASAIQLAVSNKEGLARPSNPINATQGSGIAKVGGSFVGMSGSPAASLVILNNNNNNNNNNSTNNIGNPNINNINPTGSFTRGDMSQVGEGSVALISNEIVNNNNTQTSSLLLQQQAANSFNLLLQDELFHHPLNSALNNNNSSSGSFHPPGTGGALPSSLSFNQQQQQQQRFLDVPVKPSVHVTTAIDAVARLMLQSQSFLDYSNANENPNASSNNNNSIILNAAKDEPAASSTTTTSSSTYATILVNSSSSSLTETCPSWSIPFSHQLPPWLAAVGAELFDISVPFAAFSLSPILFLLENQSSFILQERNNTATPAATVSTAKNASKRGKQLPTQQQQDDNNNHQHTLQPHRGPIPFTRPWTFPPMPSPGTIFGSVINETMKLLDNGDLANISTSSLFVLASTLPSDISANNAADESSYINNNSGHHSESAKVFRFRHRIGRGGRLWTDRRRLPPSCSGVKSSTLLSILEQNMLDEMVLRKRCGESIFGWGEGLDENEERSRSKWELHELANYHMSNSCCTSPSSLTSASSMKDDKHHHTATLINVDKDAQSQMNGTKTFRGACSHNHNKSSMKKEKEKYSEKHLSLANNSLNNSAADQIGCARSRLNNLFMFERPSANSGGFATFDGEGGNFSAAILAHTQRAWHSLQSAAIVAEVAVESNLNQLWARPLSLAMEDMHQTRKKMVEVAGENSRTNCNDIDERSQLWDVLMTACTQSAHATHALAMSPSPSILIGNSTSSQHQQTVSPGNVLPPTLTTPKEDPLNFNNSSSSRNGSNGTTNEELVLWPSSRQAREIGSMLASRRGRETHAMAAIMSQPQQQNSAGDGRTAKVTWDTLSLGGGDQSASVIPNNSSPATTSNNILPTSQQHLVSVGHLNNNYQQVNGSQIRNTNNQQYNHSLHHEGSQHQTHSSQQQQQLHHQQLHNHQQPNVNYNNHINNNQNGNSNNNNNQQTYQINNSVQQQHQHQQQMVYHHQQQPLQHHLQHHQHYGTNLEQHSHMNNNNNAGSHHQLQSSSHNFHHQQQQQNLYYAQQQ